MLSQGRVSVNGKSCKIGRESVRTGDVVAIGRKVEQAAPLHGMEIIYEDEDILVIHKPAGLLTVATEHERERTAYAYLRAYLKRSEPDAKLCVVHRLDKFVSGLLAFAKSERAKIRFQSMFHVHNVERRYLAIVEGQVLKDHGTVRSSLAEDRSRRMHSTEKPGSGKQAVTHWRVLRRLSDCTALEVTLETGRKNQIRAHLSESGHPIIGDIAYGSKADPFGRIALHAFRLGFAHPITRKQLLFQTDPPPEFRRYLPAK